jgi:hypothetical protein
MRSFLFNGGPIRPNDTFRFENTTHFKTEQEDLLKKYLLDAKEKFDEQASETEG